MFFARPANLVALRWEVSSSIIGRMVSFGVEVSCAASCMAASWDVICFRRRSLSFRVYFLLRSAFPGTAQNQPLYFSSSVCLSLSACLTMVLFVLLRHVSCSSFFLFAPSLALSRFVCRLSVGCRSVDFPPITVLLLRTMLLFLWYFILLCLEFFPFFVFGSIQEVRHRYFIL